MKDDEFVRLFQLRAAKAGYDVGPVDGIVGKKTLAALDKILPKLVVISPAPEPAAEPLPEPTGAGLSAVAEARLKGVHSALVNVVREASLRSSVPFTVTEGLRSRERQAQLVKAGASKTQNSRHLTGHAVDLWPMDKNGKVLPSDAAFKKGSNEARAASAALWSGLRKISAVMKEVAKEQGVQIEWGGDWGWDAPHFQLNRKAYP